MASPSVTAGPVIVSSGGPGCGDGFVFGVAGRGSVPAWKRDRFTASLALRAHIGLPVGFGDCVSLASPGATPPAPNDALPVYGLALGPDLEFWGGAPADAVALRLFGAMNVSRTHHTSSSQEADGVTASPQVGAALVAQPGSVRVSFEVSVLTDLRGRKPVMITLQFGPAR
jgi:hypothetical protein